MSKTFIIPKITMSLKNNDDALAQVKYLGEGIFEEQPLVPVLNFYGSFPEQVTDEVKCTIARTEDGARLDLTPFVEYNLKLNGISKVDLSDVDIKLFVDLENNKSAGKDIVWTEIEPGYFNFNNNNTYGYRWEVIKDEDSGFPCYYLQAKIPNDGIHVIQEANIPPVLPLGLAWKVNVAKKETMTRQFDLHQLFATFVSDAVIEIDDTFTEKPVSGKALANYLSKQLVFEKFVVGKPDNPGTFEMYLSSDPTKTMIKGSFKLFENSTSEAAIITFNEGKLTLNESLFDELNNTEFLNEFNAYDFIPRKVLEIHKEDKITETNEVHGIQQGHKKFFNADKLDNLHLKSPSGQPIENLKEVENYVPFVNSSNILEINDTISFFDENNQPNSSLKYSPEALLETFPSADVITKETKGSGNKSVKIIMNTSEADLPTKTIIRKLVGTEEVIDTDLYTLSTDVIYYKKTGTSEMSYTAFDESVTEFTEHNDGETLTLKEDTTKILYCFIDYTKEEKIVSDEVATLINSHDIIFAKTENNINLLADVAAKNISIPSLKAFKQEIKVLPNVLGLFNQIPFYEFKYIKEAQVYGENARINAGLVIEELLAKIETEGFVEQDIYETYSDENYKYSYTEEEQEVIKKYALMLLDKSGKSQNINTSVGLLMQAAKETQERLLRLESSVEGIDAEYRPGTKAQINITGVDINQNPMYVGLNRAVRALCKEIFKDANPLNGTDFENGINADSLSRVDRIDQQINGKSIDEDENALKPTSILLNEQKGVTYPKEGETLEETKDFDGLNDAVNRLVFKVNELTKAVYQEDDITQNPTRLDTIRDNIETLLKDSYFANTYTDPTSNTTGEGEEEITTLNSIPYVEDEAVEMTDDFDHEALNSRNDFIQAEVFNQELPYKEDYQNPSKNEFTNSAEYTARTFNGKPLKLNKETLNENLSNANNGLEVLKTIYPQNLLSNTDLKDYASFLDVLIELLGKEYLIKYTENTRIETSENDTRELDRLKQDWGTRILQLEIALDSIGEKLIGSNNYKELIKETNTQFSESPIKNENDANDELENKLISLQTFCERILQWVGIEPKPSVRLDDLKNYSSEAAYIQDLVINEEQISFGYKQENDTTSILRDVRLIKDSYSNKIYIETEASELDIIPIDFSERTFKLSTNENELWQEIPFTKDESLDTAIASMTKVQASMTKLQDALKTLNTKVDSEASNVERLKTLIGTNEDANSNGTRYPQAVADTEPTIINTINKDIQWLLRALAGSDFGTNTSLESASNSFEKVLKAVYKTSITNIEDASNDGIVELTDFTIETLQNLTENTNNFIEVLRVYLTKQRNFTGFSEIDTKDGATGTLTAFTTTYNDIDDETKGMWGYTHELNLDDENYDVTNILDFLIIFRSKIADLYSKTSQNTTDIQNIKVVLGMEKEEGTDTPNGLQQRVEKLETTTGDLFDFEGLVTKLISIIIFQEVDNANSELKFNENENTFTLSKNDETNSGITYSYYLRSLGYPMKHNNTPFVCEIIAYKDSYYNSANSFITSDVLKGTVLIQDSESSPIIRFENYEDASLTNGVFLEGTSDISFV